MPNDLKDIQCDVCGGYCFGSAPHPWTCKTTPRGKIKMCSSCSVSDISTTEDPVFTYRERRLLAQVAVAEARLAELEKELDGLYE